MVVVAVADIAAGGGFLHVHLTQVGGDSSDGDVIEILLFRTHHARGADLHAHVLGQLETIAQGLIVVPGDVAIAAHCFHVGFRIADDAHLVDDENVGTEVGDALGEILVHAADQGNDQDQGGNGEDQKSVV